LTVVGPLTRLTPVVNCEECSSDTEC